MAMMATGAFAQPSASPADRVLYDRGIKSIERGDYAAARLTLNELANTYADSEYLAKAKLAIAVSWLRQGDENALAQAEAEYKDFILFYPNMKEAAELQVGEPLRKIREQKAAVIVYRVETPVNRAYPAGGRAKGTARRGRLKNRWTFCLLSITLSCESRQWRGRRRSVRFG